MDRLGQLKQKYDAALKKMTETGVRLQNLHVQEDKLFVKGAAPSEEAKGQVWWAIQQADAAHADVLLDLTVDPSRPAPAPAPAQQTYSVKPGDTLSKISKQFYGDANKYMKIFEANRETLNDPDTIKPGQVLKIPAA
jgi:nucleoid-associated protein YgaU